MTTCIAPDARSRGSIGPAAPHDLYARPPALHAAADGAQAPHDRPRHWTPIPAAFAASDARSRGHIGPADYPDPYAHPPALRAAADGAQDRDNGRMSRAAEGQLRRDEDRLQMGFASLYPFSP